MVGNAPDRRTQRGPAARHRPRRPRARASRRSRVRSACARRPSAPGRRLPRRRRGARRLLGRGRADLDVVVDGDAGSRSLAALGGEARRPRPLRDRDRGELATGSVDLARARAESLPAARRAPRGAPGGARRGPGPPRLHGQRDGGAARRARRADRPPRRASTTCAPGSCGSCTTRSFVDDPTRALRAARYAARLGLRARARDRRAAPRRRPRDGLRRTASRPSSRRLAAEPEPEARLRAARREWGLVRARPGAAGELIDAVGRRSLRPSRGRGRRRAAPRCRARGDARRSARAGRGRSPRARPSAPSEARRRGRAGGARSSSSLARALGAEWLDDYVDRVARRPARDHRRGPARGRRRPRARRSAAASPRRCGRSSTARSAGATTSSAIALEAARGPETLI